MILDARNTVIAEGSRVAYNRSGDVVPGVVQRIVTEPVTWKYDRATSEVRHARPGRIEIKCDLDGKISKVRHAVSILVLLDNEH